jgi:hypothetical protein
MKIKGNKLTDAKRSVNVTFFFEDDNGERQEIKTKVIYRALSPKLLRELADMTEASEENRRAVAEQLAKVVYQLPDVVGEDDQPIKVDVDFFDALSFDNLTAINKAIQEDIHPNA